MEDKFKNPNKFYRMKEIKQELVKVRKINKR